MPNHAYKPVVLPGNGNAAWQNRLTRRDLEMVGVAFCFYRVDEFAGFIKEQAEKC